MILFVLWIAWLYQTKMIISKRFEGDGKFLQNVVRNILKKTLMIESHKSSNSHMRTCLVMHVDYVVINFQNQAKSSKRKRNKWNNLWKNYAKWMIKKQRENINMGTWYTIIEKNHNNPIKTIKSKSNHVKRSK
jgi:hypothetical protein